ncbi:N-6 DNA methylase, partial [Bacteriovoracaceae bacterium]|nr:N-6 DNA methylase [Bacteriovoracaceae bacterium]
MDLNDYISDINSRFVTGDAREHTYRPSFQNLIEALVPNTLALNDPARIECGAPDFIITRENLPIGYVEAKDINLSLDSNEHAEQLNRYRSSLSNFSFTNYLDFYFYYDGEKYAEISIGRVEKGRIVPLEENFSEFLTLIGNFSIRKNIVIDDPKKLATIMARKAKLISAIIDKSIVRDIKIQRPSTLVDQYKAIEEILINDISSSEFSDIYAQTMTYGLFAAKVANPDVEEFSRSRAAGLIPKSNPFLRNLFQYIAGEDLDERLVWIVDSLSNVFKVTDVPKLLENFNEDFKKDDPLIHFYETFLTEYDPALRKARGVWYTLLPVVNFIVNSVDKILENSFNLDNGIANNSKVEIEVETQSRDKRTKTGFKTITQKVHKVQILDPAVGTGTFLAEVVKVIYGKMGSSRGIWSKFVEDDIIPRLYGFEILMASYSMAHLKLDLLFNELGYTPSKEQRFKVFLTNALEEHHPDTGTLFASWLSKEANEANYIKRDTPVMVVIGNPPYSISSCNKGEWITNLCSVYKENLNEINIQPLSDDYI